MGKRGRAGSSHPPGGYKQQLKWNTESAPGVAKPSSLAVFLVKQWAWGHLSSPMLQKIAFHALQDGAAHADLQKLARLGTSGMHQQNIHTELVRCLHEQSTTRSLSTMQVYVKQMHTHVRCEQHVLLPHELFAALYHNHRDAFTKRMLGGDPANIAKWWTAMHNHPGYVAHPLKDRANHMQKCVPLALHGDGVPVTGVGKAWGKSAEGYGWSSMIGVGTTVDVYFLIWIMYTKLIVRSPGLDSSKTFFRKLRWSLYWLFLGLWPARDEHETAIVGGKAGEPLAGGYYAALFCLKGDLDHMFKAYQLQCPTSLQPCNLCRANSSDLPWTEFKHGSAWENTVWSDAAWIASHPNRHALFHLPGVSISSFIPDVLHVTHLGVYQWCFGSILHYLTKYVMRDSAVKNLETIWQIVKQVYKVP